MEAYRTCQPHVGQNTNRRVICISDLIVIHCAAAGVSLCALVEL